MQVVRRVRSLADRAERRVTEANPAMQERRYLLRLSLELMAVAVGVSLLEYLAGWGPTVVQIFGERLVPRVPRVFPAPGFAAILLFLILNQAQPRYFPWERWRVPLLLVAFAATFALLIQPESGLRLATLLAAYGIAMHAYVSGGVRQGLPVALTLVASVAAALIFGHSLTLLQAGIWGSGLLVIAAVSRLGREERAARTHAESLVVELRAAERQLREYTAHAEENAALRERERLARELHDTLAQGLATIIMRLDSARLAAESDPQQSSEQVERAKQLAEDYLREARAAIWRLRSATLDAMDLDAALRQLGANASNDSCHVSVRVALPSEATIPQALRLALYRMAQEAIANVGKHACASAVEIELSAEGAYVFLTITDNGVGFDLSQAQSSEADPRGGFGLLGLRERARLLGGDCEILSMPGSGTQIAAKIPLDLGVSVGQEGK